MEADSGIILQIMGISIVMVIFSMLMNKKYMISREQMMAQQDRMTMLQEKLMKAQKFGNSQLFQETQAELAEEMKTMMKKQMLPMCLRSLIFLGIFGILGLIYGKYDSIFPFPILFFGKGWAAVYILTSIGFSLIIALFKKLLKKGQPQQQGFVDIADIRSGMANINLGNQMNGESQGMQYSDRNDFNEENLPEWKKKLSNYNSESESNQNSDGDIPEWKKKLRD